MFKNVKVQFQFKMEMTLEKAFLALWSNPSAFNLNFKFNFIYTDWIITCV